MGNKRLLLKNLTLLTTISSFFLIRQILTVWPIIQRGIWVYPLKFFFKKFRRVYLQKTRKAFQLNFSGSSKDPLIYLGIFAVLLFGVLIFKTSSFSPQNTELSATLQENALASISQRFLGGMGQESLFLGNIGLEEPEFPSLNIVQNNSLVGISSPISVSPKVLGSLGNFNEEAKEISEYVVQSGDSLSLIAEKFNISLNTLLWANDLSSSSIISSRQKLIILPVSGILHHVKNGETLSGIAKIYQGDAAEIIFFNELSGENIFIGDILIIPDGKMPPKPQYTSTPVSQIPLAGSYFIFPTQGKISQGLHWYNAVDIANDCGNPAYASAGGEVLSIKYGYNRGAGNYIKILHPNGVVTFYGHLNSILVGAGQPVSQGQIIALIGGKPGTPGAGISTGCHLHFEVRGARNPFTG